ncbi:hypothetical protein NEUTE2DRAFT_69079 [Neurospora tetrasperma FGSC 2509]|nr:hypothetical protein NEUTE2DRAFT_69079 [Neurospora tetrasperma FGSC 2509]
MCSSSVGGPSSILFWIQFRTTLIGSYIQPTNNATKPFLNSPQQRPDWSNSRRNERMGLHGICAAPCALFQGSSWLGLPPTMNIPYPAVRPYTGERGKGRAEGFGLPPIPFLLSFLVIVVGGREAWSPPRVFFFFCHSTGNFVIALSCCDDLISVTNPNKQSFRSYD